MSKVNHPKHYRSDSGHEAIDVIEAWELGFNTGNALKYISRCGLKHQDKVEDLEKAIWYLQREIQLVENKQKSNFEKDVILSLNSD